MNDADERTAARFERHIKSVFDASEARCTLVDPGMVFGMAVTDSASLNAGGPVEAYHVDGHRNGVAIHVKADRETFEREVMGARDR